MQFPRRDNLRDSQAVRTRVGFFHILAGAPFQAVPLGENIKAPDLHLWR
jgi:hypothetical protein